MDKNRFKHKIIEVVKFHEVDMLGVCNNAVYFNYFEDARIKYLQDLQKQYNIEDPRKEGSFFIMAHIECDYYLPAHLDDELTVHSRVEFIKKSSFGFKHVVERKGTGDVLAEGGGVLVHIELKNKKSLPLTKEFFDAVSDYEDEVKIIQQ